MPPASPNANEIVPEKPVEACERKSRRAAVIGGGLLGLEAAKVLVGLGLEASVLEVAPGLMPRQLDRHAAAILRERVEAMGVAVHVVRRTDRIEPREGGLTIHFQNAKPLDVDLLVIAAGVRPRDELAKAAGLVMGKRGGVVIDSHLRTSDPNIFAIGECASFNEHAYGLVAPCYRMAGGHLVQKLCRCGSRGDDGRPDGLRDSCRNAAETTKGPNRAERILGKRRTHDPTASANVSHGRNDGQRRPARWICLCAEKQMATQ